MSWKDYKFQRYVAEVLKVLIICVAFIIGYYTPMEQEMSYTIGGTLIFAWYIFK